jgi:ubiquinone/menaquinone biosynthesis C-methylase UbiE
MSDNAQQVEFWNGPAGERWASSHESLDWALSMINAAFMAFVAAKPGERVLDIGCGNATATLALSQAVGARGSATGIDISIPMLRVARERSRASSAHVEFIEADASAYKFKPAFDLIVSRFGVMFFADPEPAFANIRKGLAPKGRLAFVCWRTMPENTWAWTPLAAARNLLPPQEPMDPYAPGPFAFAEVERTLSILRDAGFTEPRAERLDTVMLLGANVDEASRFSLEVGPLARLVAEADEATRNKVRDAVRSVLGQYETPAGIAPPAACWLVSAHA